MFKFNSIVGWLILAAVVYGVLEAYGLLRRSSVVSVAHRVSGRFLLIK